MNSSYKFPQKVRTFLVFWLYLTGSIAFGKFPTLQDPTFLENGFKNPPKEAKPYTWWHWSNGNVTKRGITADLEAMAAAGIGGAYLFNVNMGFPDGPARFLQPEWLSMIEHTVKESDRLGLEFGVHNCDGYTQAGGPWIKPETSMKILTWSTITLTGGKKEKIVIKKPFHKQNYYRDIALVAFPEVEGSSLPNPENILSISGSVPPDQIALLHDQNMETATTFKKVVGKKENYIDYSFQHPVTLRSLIVKNPGKYSHWWVDVTGRLSFSEDGKDYTEIQRFPLNLDVKENPSKSVTIAFAPQKAKHFRFSFSNRRPFGFSEIELSSKKHPHLWEVKSGWTRYREHGGEAPALAMSPNPKKEETKASYSVPIQAVRVLQPSLLKGNVLEYSLPKGKWRIIRIGYTSTGKTVRPATAEGRGLECDKLNSGVVRFHLEQYVGKLVEKYGEYVGKSFTTFETDSWGVGIQNWTEGFEQQFKNSMGYDILTFMPLLLEGYTIGDYQVSEKVMWDWRRFIADQISKNYFQTVHQYSKEKGLTYVAESSGRQQYMYDPITYQRYNDIPMGEFWTDKFSGWVRVDNKVAASAAHLTGRSIVASEAYTSSTNSCKWTQHPYLLKAQGDEAFTKGVNRFVFHTFSHQPFPELKPGFVMGPWGMHNHSGNTWFRPAVAWYQYIARCQFLLQQGTFVADVLHYLGEEVPARVGFHDELYPKLPESYDFDSCDYIALMEATVKAGKIVLPSGMEYSVLLLPKKDTMRPVALRKIQQLIAEGATVVGKLPTHSSSHSDGAKADKEIEKIVKQLTGNKSHLPRADLKFGKGRLFWGRSFEEIFDQIGIVPDFEHGDKKLHFIHRKWRDKHYYFVSNPHYEAISTNARFRVKNQRVAFWNPETGKTKVVARYWNEGEQTVVPLKLEPAASIFVVFDAGSSPTIQSIERGGKDCTNLVDSFFEKDVLKLGIKEHGDYQVTFSAGKQARFTVDQLPQEQNLVGPWFVDFPEGWGAPETIELGQLDSLHLHPVDGVKHFSGTATYTHSFTLSPEWRSYQTLIDLGKVAVIAELTVNGKKVDTLWKPPFTADISPVLREGKNRLEIKVTNLWVNRLIGDAQYPDQLNYKGEYPTMIAKGKWPEWLYQGEPMPGPQVTFSPRKVYQATDKLVESGLIGPVKLIPKKLVGIGAK